MTHEEIERLAEAVITYGKSLSKPAWVEYSDVPLAHATLQLLEEGGGLAKVTRMMWDYLENVSGEELSVLWAGSLARRDSQAALAKWEGKA